MKTMKQRRLFGLSKIEWETPQWLFDQLDAEFHFDLDVCATPENAKCDRYFTPEEDGLRKPWLGRCWMNPPYGSEIARWVEKAHYESRGDAFTDGALVVGLLPVRSDTAWWHDQIIAAKAEVRFLRGRLRFSGSNTNAPFPSAVVVWS